MYAIMTVGVSASGKSSLAQSYDDFEVLERDLIRFTQLPEKYTGWKGKKPYVFSKENEAMVTAIHGHTLKAYAHMGENVILSDTWLDKGNRRYMYKTLKSLGYSVEVIVVHVPLKVAIERDSYRGNWSVGENVIRRQWEKFQGAKAQLVGEVDKYGISVIHYNNFEDYEGKELL